MRIRIAHSPDSDDAFMFYALTAGKIYTDGLQIEGTHINIFTYMHFLFNVGLFGHAGRMPFWIKKT